MRVIVIPILLLFVSFQLTAQTTAENEVMESIHQLFTGMRANDSSMVSAVLHQEVEMATVAKNKDGKTILVKSENASAFLNAIAMPKDEIWDEQISDEIVQIDGNMASVWCSYTFYRGKNFSHCGVNAFHLVKIDGSWQIVQLIDTRRIENCK